MGERKRTKAGSSSPIPFRSNLLLPSQRPASFFFLRLPPDFFFSCQRYPMWILLGIFRVSEVGKSRKKTPRARLLLPSSSLPHSSRLHGFPSRYSPASLFRRIRAICRFRPPLLRLSAIGAYEKSESASPILPPSCARSSTFSFLPPSLLSCLLPFQPRNSL